MLVISLGDQVASLLPTLTCSVHIEGSTAYSGELSCPKVACRTSGISIGNPANESDAGAMVISRANNMSKHRFMTVNSS